MLLVLLLGSGTEGGRGRPVDRLDALPGFLPSGILMFMCMFVSTIIIIISIIIIIISISISTSSSSSSSSRTFVMIALILLLVSSSSLVVLPSGAVRAYLLKCERAKTAFPTVVFPNKYMIK